MFSKGISGAGRWAVRYSEFGQPSFCAVIEGSCRLAVDGEEPVSLAAGDFVLLPATPAFTMSSFEPATPRRIDPKVTSAPTEEVRHGRPDGPADVRLLGGYFVFDSPDAALLVSLLPAWFTSAASSGFRRWSGSSARKPASGGRAATSCWRVSSRCC